MNNDLTDLNIKWIRTLRKNRVFSIIHNTYQPQEGKTFRLALNKETVLAELWDWAKQMSSLPFENQKSASLICHLRKDVQGIVRALKTDFSELLGFRSAQFGFGLGQTETELIFRYQFGKFTETFSFGFNQNRTGR